MALKVKKINNFFLISLFAKKNKYLQKFGDLCKFFNFVKMDLP
jgi:hypothetical protein